MIDEYWKNVEKEKFIKIKPKRFTFADLYYREGSDPLEIRKWLVRDGHTVEVVDRVLWMYAQKLANGERFYAVNGHKELPIRIKQAVSNIERKQMGYDTIRYKKESWSILDSAIRVVIYSMFLLYTALFAVYGDRIWRSISQG